LSSKREGFRTADSLIAGAALYETLFNKRTIGERDEETATSILIDTLKDDYLFDFEDIDLESLKVSNDYLANKFKETPEISEK
jgi:hypothetical protein